MIAVGIASLAPGFLAGAGRSRRAPLAVAAALLAIAGGQSVAASSEPAGGPAAAGAARTEQVRPDTAAVARLVQKSQIAPVPVIVEFAISGAAGLPRRPEAMLGTAAVSTQRDAINRVRDGILAGLAGTEHGNVKTYRTLPLIALEVGPEALRRLAADPRVMRIHEDVAAAPDLAQSIPLIGADVAWDEGYSGSGSVVAILDTGVAGSHPFLTGKVVSEACYSTTSSTLRSKSVCPGGVAESTAPRSGRNCAGRIDGCEHGTHVAGIAAGRGSRFSGVARDADLISIQVFSRVTGAICAEFGRASPCAVTWRRDQVAALERVLELRSTLDIAAVNMSLSDGGAAFADDCDGDERKLVIDDLRAAGVATVVASGNDGLDGRIGAPACISSAVAVGATTKRGGLWRYSNHARIVDLLAPGVGIRSSVPGTRFAVLSGTSMAAPHVAGAFAVLHAADPAASVDEIETALIDTGKPVGRAGVLKPRIRLDIALDALVPVHGQPANDDLAGAIFLAGASGTDFGDNAAASREPGEPIHAGVGAGHSVWWLWQAPGNGVATVSTFGSSFDTVLGVYTGGNVDLDVARLSEVGSNDDSGGGLQSEVTFATVAGTVYAIAVDGFDDEQGSITLNYGFAGDGASAVATLLAGGPASSR